MKDLIKKDYKSREARRLATTFTIYILFYNIFSASGHNPYLKNMHLYLQKMANLRCLSASCYTMICLTMGWLVS